MVGFVLKPFRRIEGQREEPFVVGASQDEQLGNGGDIQICRLPTFSAVLQLLKPITWFPPMWAYLCGLISSGVSLLDEWALALMGILLCGPLVCGVSQIINDWHDRHVDAVNEPGRPIPSGRVPGRWGLYLAWGWTGLSLIVALQLGLWVLIATVFGLILAWAYSAPPFRLKENGWWGNAACGLCYEGLAWFTGAAALLMMLPDWKIIMLALLYSVGAHGIMTLNDFKAIEGDRQHGIRSLPVQLGVHGAAKLACAVMTLPQLGVIGLLIFWGLPIYAGLIVIVVIIQLSLMARYLLDHQTLAANPLKNAALYNATGTSAYVGGMMVAAFGVRELMDIL